MSRALVYTRTCEIKESKLVKEKYKVTNMNEQDFSKKLAKLTEKAKQNGFYLSNEEIMEAFPDLLQNNEQMNLLLGYFNSQKITVGDQSEIAEQLSIEDQNYLEEYQMEISDIEILEEDKLRELIIQAVKGDSDARMLLLQQYLNKVIGLAKLYSGQGILLEDLIGEGNLALAEAVLQMGCLDIDGNVVEEADGFFGKYMMNAMESMINQELFEKDMGEKMAETVNRVADAAAELSHTMMRKVTIQDLVRHTDLTKEEIWDAINASANKIEDIDDPLIDKK